MENILHLSDFHIKSSMPDPDKNDIFCSLIKTIKAQNPENLIIVYTGDIIDSRDILISPKGTVEEKKQQWKEQAKQSFALATKYFKYLTKELQVDNDHIIIVVGNHDINQFDNEFASFDCPIDSIKSIEYGIDRFELISEFLNNLNYQFSNSENHFRRIGDFNFIVANTQWVDKHNPKIKGLCVNCNSLNNIFETYKDTLLKTKEQKDKKHNIFVAHNPERDCCEYSCFLWPEGAKAYVEKQIVEYCGIKLFGDKHTSSIYKYDYIVGAPLDSDFIPYGIHTFDGIQYTHKSLNYDKNSGLWIFKHEIESIKEILRCSVDYLKPEVFNCLKIENDFIDTVVNSIYEFNTIKMSDAWNNFDELFSSFVSLKHPVLGQPGININYNNSLIDYITDLIRNTKQDTCLTIRGNVGTGKSVFLTALYLNLLYEFSVGSFLSIPVYINIEKIIDSILSEQAKSEQKVQSDFCIDNPDYFDRIKSVLNQLFITITSLSNKYKKKSLLIIDGVKQYRFYDYCDIEEYINSTLIQYKQKGVVQSSIICIDTDNNLSLEYTIFHQKKDSEYIAYFDSILTYDIESKNKLNRFIRAYCLLNGYAEDSSLSVITTIERLQIPSVNLSFMVIAGKNLVAKSTDPIFNILYRHFLGSVLEGSDWRNFLAKISYLLYNEKYNYTEIKQNNPNLGYRSFNKIIRQKLFAQILIAIHYCNQIQTNIKTVSLSFTSKKVLNRLYGHEECIFILGYIRFFNFVEKIRVFEEKHYKNLDYSGKSTITYLIGRIINNKEQLKEILKKEEKALNKPKNNATNKSFYEYCIAKRSIYISRLARGIDDFFGPGYYFEKLLTDNYERRINRKFYLQFYGDRNDYQIEPIRDVILNGLDFYHTYQLLATRLKKWFLDEKKEMLLELELFTLCDLIQIHLDYPKVTDRYENGAIHTYEKKEDRPDSFFYNKRYTEPEKSNRAINVLQFLIDIIDNYLNKSTGIKKRKFKQYLHVRKDQFSYARDSIVANRPINTFDVNNLFTKLSLLSKIKKTGWFVEDTSDIIDDSDIYEIVHSDKCHETTLEHVYDCFLIGLLYLPDSIKDNPTYNKNTILKMLLIHDLGEAYLGQEYPSSDELYRAGDYPPSYCYYKETRIAEDKHCVRIFLSGTHENTANLTEYLDLWNKWHSKTYYHRGDDINIQIAVEIDKIQMIYKLFSLLLEDKLNLSSERINDFYISSNNITTQIGINIFNTLIINNNAFRTVAENNKIHFREL